MPHWNRWKCCRDRFDAAFLFVVLKKKWIVAARVLAYVAKAGRLPRKRSRVGNEAVWCCVYHVCLATPPTSTKRMLSGKRRHGQRCRVSLYRNKKNYYCKGFQHHLLLTHPEAMYFFFPWPAMFHAESLVHKGPPHIVDPFPSGVFLSALLLGPKCIQQGFIRVGPGCVLVCGELGTFIFYFIFCCNVI